MKLVSDRNPGAFAVKVPCIACGKMLLLAEAQIDVDGQAFMAYYHRGCVPIGEVLAPEAASGEGVGDATVL